MTRFESPFELLVRDLETLRGHVAVMEERVRVARHGVRLSYGVASAAHSLFVGTATAATLDTAMESLGSSLGLSGIHIYAIGQSDTQGMTFEERAGWAASVREIDLETHSVNELRNPAWVARLLRGQFVHAHGDEAEEEFGDRGDGAAVESSFLMVPVRGVDGSLSNILVLEGSESGLDWLDHHPESVSMLASAFGTALGRLPG